MAKPKTFEEKMARLSEIADLMENGNVPLDKLVALYEEGINLSKEMKRYIDEVKVKIEVLNGKDIEDAATPAPDEAPGA